MHYRDYDEDRKGITKRTVQAVPSFDGVEILPQGSRAGNAERDRAIEHIRDMTEQGYLDPIEGDRRIAHCAEAKKTTALNELTSDLPPYKARWYFDWDNTRHFVPVLVGGLMVSLILAIVPATVIDAMHKFHTAMGLGIAVPSLVIGIVGAIACIGGFIAKTVE